MKISVVLCGIISQKKRVPYFREVANGNEYGIIRNLCLEDNIMFSNLVVVLITDALS